MTGATAPRPWIEVSAVLLTMLVSTSLPAHVAGPLRTLGPDLRLVPFDAETWPAEADTATSLLTWAMPPADYAMALDRARGINLILSDYAGVNALLIPAVNDRDITLCNASGAHARPIAEWVLMLV